MNDALTEDNEQGMFVTVFLGMVNLKTGVMNFCNAGHNPPVVGVPPVFLEVESNAPIGLWSDIEFEGQTVENIKGQPIFVYSDGLNEAENPQQEQFSDERLLQFLGQSQFTSSREVVESLKAEVEKHRNGAEPNDDLTMLCLLVK
jgi:serine phosphatase RsbU (regulator of sigma subunit)